MWHLYKYQPVNKLVLSNLARQKLWFSRPAVFNDPFEFRLKRNGEAVGVDELRSQNPHLQHLDDDELIAKAIDAFEEKIRAMGICCFTEIPDSILMWSHYADSHRGICLDFCGDEGSSPGDDSLYKVDYQTEYPEIDFGNPWHKDGLAKVLWTKEDAWSHEQEWRGIIVEGDRLREYLGKLNEVIFGLRTHASDIALVRSILEGQDGITFSRVVRDEGIYRLHVKAI